MEENINLNYKEVMNKIIKARKALIGTRYILDEKILNKAVNKEKYLQSEEEYVYYISTLINSFYSTRMGGDRLYKVVEHITKYKNIEEFDQIANVIEKADKEKFYITKVNNETKKYSAFSFLTKYYAIHNRIIKHQAEYSDFPIYDSRVQECLKKIINSCRYKKYANNYSNEFNEKMKKFLIKDIKDYRKLKIMLGYVIDEINVKQKDNKINYSLIDNYFWEIGKSKETNSSL